MGLIQVNPVEGHSEYWLSSCTITDERSRQAAIVTATNVAGP
jgi:hypothetical protein